MPDIRIAVIDNGIYDKILKKSLEHKIYIDCQKRCVRDFNCVNDFNFPHGTICALILEEKFSDGILSSVKILNNNGVGNIEKLKPALEWCYNNNIFLVNLSLGTVDFKDKNIVRELINYYANRGMIIIAATANNGYKSFPACFSNVISVAIDDTFDVNEKLLRNKGVDFTVSFKHKINIAGENIKISKSNSYAAPYITAKVGEILSENSEYSICQIKKKLYAQRHKKFIQYCPDWIEVAWISSGKKISKANYYFQTIESFEEISQADTIILYSEEDLKKYCDFEKHIVYLGNSLVGVDYNKQFFWCPKYRKEQIIQTEPRNGTIDIPIIFCNFDSTQDSIWLITEIRNRFDIDGYNVFAADFIVDCVLYDLEYIPESIYKKDKDKLYNFLYWQVYYNRSDLILYGIETDNIIEIVKEADMVLNINKKEKHILIEIYCDNIKRLEKKADALSYNIIQEVYLEMVRILTEE